ncbi:Peptidase M32, carboxypeptidase Taq metallopeptidase, partial [mine drainage metagenome]
WAEKMQSYVGITPPDDLQGALQDIHWTGGLGNFIGYTMGNVISAQLWAAMRREMPGAEEGIARGEFAPILEWLRTHVHRLGSTYEVDELVRRATGSDLSATPYLGYIREKFSELYGF